ncbi:bidirectional sugar transporter SWEET12-like [Diospyros lotus]|uniref:bidirectional sugar transporter SWEET12-like n=1 Tax=Diospyros lotus TaxID=55363 RepID=UPI0022557FCE|nr:bidirectional sugar transporter SWEET12-like [Diospyros lotus]
MAMFSMQHSWVFTFGILGNIVSFMVYLAPVPTFHRIVKKKSTEGFESLPYLVAHFSSVLWIYYACLKSNAFLLMSINSVGCVIETIYIALYIAYAPKKARMYTLKLLLLLNFGGLFTIVVLSHFLAKGSSQVHVLGWVCLVFSVCVFVAPLSIMRQVISTKSVEFMPFSLSLCLTLNAVMWFFYGLLERDIYVALPNILGFAFGLLQMVLYLFYKNHKRLASLEEQKQLPSVVIMKQCPTMAADVHPKSSPENKLEAHHEDHHQNLQLEGERSKHGERMDASDQV